MKSRFLSLHAAFLILVLGCGEEQADTEGQLRLLHRKVSRASRWR